MSTTPEGRVKLDIRGFLKARGSRCWWYCPVQNGMGRSGIPDFICCENGFMIAIEAKAPGCVGNATVNQVREGAAIMAAGGIWIVVDAVEQLYHVFTRIQAWEEDAESIPN